MQISVDIDFMNAPVKVKAENRLHWYDPIKKEMKYFSGGQLSFEYKEDEFGNYRMLPKVVDMEIIQYRKVTNEEKINTFFSNYIKNTGSSVSVVSKDNKTIVFNVPDEEVEVFTDQLDRNSFRFDM